MPERISYSELRRSLTAACEQVCDRHETLVIERRRGEDLVLLPKEDFQSLEETACRLSYPEERPAIAAGAAGRGADRATFASLDEVENALGV
jgi:antitoxin YefM